MSNDITSFIPIIYSIDLMEKVFRISHLDPKPPDTSIEPITPLVQVSYLKHRRFHKHSR